MTGVEVEDPVGVGIDGGGSYTKVVIVSMATGEFLSGPDAIVTGPANWNSVGAEAAQRAIREALTGALKVAGRPARDVVAIAACISGLHTDADASMVISWLQPDFPNALVEVCRRGVYTRGLPVSGPLNCS